MFGAVRIAILSVFLCGSLSVLASGTPACAHGGGGHGGGGHMSGGGGGGGGFSVHMGGGSGGSGYHYHNYGYRSSGYGSYGYMTPSGGGNMTAPFSGPAYIGPAGYSTYVKTYSFPDSTQTLSQLPQTSPRALSAKARSLTDLLPGPRKTSRLKFRHGMPAANSRN